MSFSSAVLNELSFSSTWEAGERDEGQGQVNRPVVSLGEGELIDKYYQSEGLHCGLKV